MPKERLLIVAKTRMSQGICVSAISTAGDSRRLLKANGFNQDNNTSFDIGQIWEIEFETRSNLDPPHIEDVLVSKQEYKDNTASVLNTIKATLDKNRLAIWKGSANKLFHGLLNFDTSGSAYINQAKGIPDRSTWFWELDEPIVLIQQERDGKVKSHYQYKNNPMRFKVPYVGLSEPIKMIHANTLLRVSLARWWQRDENTEERCYLQLSGWYL